MNQTTSHDHDHDHHHAGHSHAPQVTGANERRIAIVFAMTAGYALVQAVGGWLSGSLALIADSGHMVSDAAALLLALIAYRVARRAATPRVSYGFHRVRVLAALANGATLLLLVAWIAWEAVARFRQPIEVLAGPMLIVAAIGLAVNIAGFAILRAGDSGDGNLRGAMLHVLGDLLGSVGAIAAAIGIMLTGWTVLDPILSVLVALLVVRSAWGLVRASVFTLIQGTPTHIDPDAVLADLVGLPGVAEARHFHAWALADSRAVATVHVSPAPGTDPLSLPPVVAAWLAERHGVAHATVEVNAPGAIRDAEQPPSHEHGA
ncbi:MAG: cation diffusion facilitator family transporter [Paracoccus sp. (in: a-proteobacteria)]|uniref:cation diffusion facilitator family transporter n=1 Tax=Paracoccus sp. TaxID=267 RepID=UPI0026E06007|nr:cation diffusion facilitator family transporter [Paracoccus sp. (in: a-proteobacteria)]MDO5630617.1 cation diffusion facilitator family transporter [Paracoccus sp. (in: a-proteobacteria)]